MNHEPPARIFVEGDYRRLRVAVCILLPIFVILGAWNSYKPTAQWMVVCGISLFTCQFGMRFFKCPRCRKTFFFDHNWRFWSENCLHCGFPKWQEADYVSPSLDAYQNQPVHEMASDVPVSTRERDSKFLILVLRDDPEPST